jgi:hypothetical protein
MFSSRKSALGESPKKVLHPVDAAENVLLPG